MTAKDPLENMLRKLRYQAAAERRQETLSNIFDVMDEFQDQAPTAGRPQIWKLTVNTRAGRLALAAAVILIVLGGVTFWPVGSNPAGQWWLGSRAAWGQELLDSLEKIDAVIYRQRVGRASDFGLPEMSRGWERRYNAKDRYRRDRYDDGVNIMNTQWVFPDGNDLRMVEVSYEYECYFERKNEAYGFVGDFMDRMRSYVQLLDKADRILDTEVFDGRKCVGFEISTGKYANNPQGSFDRIWFDVETRLPVRIERHRPESGFDVYVESGFSAPETMIIIHDQFQYFAEVPVDLFTPAIPAGYINAHPDDVRAAGDRQAKGELVYAKVPEGLKERIIAALKTVNRGSYREGSTGTSLARRTCFVRNAWRTDYPDAGDVQITYWYVLTGAVPEGPFELTDNLSVTETMVNYWEKNYRIIDHTEQYPPRHPMARILFTAGLINRADRFYESRQIDGVECFGFDVSAKKYGDNPDGAIERVWFDAVTALPVRIETHWPQRDGSGTVTTILDQFTWNPVLPEDFFTAQIPSGFTLKAKE